MELFCSAILFPCTIFSTVTSPLPSPPPTKKKQYKYFLSNKRELVSLYLFVSEKQGQHWHFHSDLVRWEDGNIF